MQQRAEVWRGLICYKFAHLNRANSQSSSTQERESTYFADNLGTVGDAGGSALLRPLRLAR